MTPAAEQGLGEALALEERIPDLDGRGLREHTARGVIINAIFQIGLAALMLVRRMLVAVFLTPAELGVWGIVVITVMTLFFLKNSSISDKFVQQSDADQETAFQKALTFELAVTLGFVALVAVLLPVFAAAYDQPEIVAPALVMLAAVVGNSLQAPTWVFYRRMAFRRQRELQAIDPVVAFVVTIALAAAGIGYWSLIIGLVVGSWVGAAFAIRACPYKLRLHLDRAGFRDYFSFSWPLFIAGAGGLVVAQGSALVGSHAVGIAGVGAISLAASVVAFSDGVDGIVTQTLYPAICAVRDRTDLLFESFVKSNRIALMWGMPFGLGLALFAPDLVHFVLGERWHSAIIVLQAFGVIAAFDQLGFNWSAFLRARNDTRPMAIVATVTMVAFAAITAPLLVVYDLPGYAAGMVGMTAVVLVVRTYYLGRLFSGFRMMRHCLRAIAPSVPAVAAVVALKLVFPGEAAAAVAVELAVYAAITVAATVTFERELLREVLGYLRSRPAGEDRGVAPAARRPPRGAGVIAPAMTETGSWG